jgi:hypothetical protein
VVSIINNYPATANWATPASKYFQKAAAPRAILPSRMRRYRSQKLENTESKDIAIKFLSVPAQKDLTPEHRSNCSIAVLSERLFG